MSEAFSTFKNQIARLSSLTIPQITILFKGEAATLAQPNSVLPAYELYSLQCTKLY